MLAAGVCPRCRLRAGAQLAARVVLSIAVAPPMVALPFRVPAVRLRLVSVGRRCPSALSARRCPTRRSSGVLRRCRAALGARPLPRCS